MQDFAGDAGGGLQDQDAIHDVADLTRPAQRRKPAIEAAEAVGQGHWGLDEARRDGVDPDAAGGELDGH